MVRISFECTYGMLIPKALMSYILLQTTKVIFSDCDVSHAKIAEQIDIMH